MRRIEYEILYGGRRGGGKTDCGINWLLYDKDNPRYRSLVIRKNTTDLVDWVDRAARIYEKLGAIKTGIPPSFTFPGGAVIRTGHLKDENAYTKYQGHEYHKILIEELTQIPNEQNYIMLISSCRSTIPEIKPQIFSTCNPDGAGFYWVKKRWNLKGIPTDIIKTEYVDPETQTHLDRVFIPAGINDNPYLDRDPSYRAFLNSLPDGLREAWRDGSWDDPVIEGAYYTQLLLQAKKENRIGIVPFDPALKVHTVWDLGYDDSMAIGFWQRTNVDIRIINYYENNCFGIDHYLAKLDELKSQYKYNYGKHFMPSDANVHELTTGLTRAQTIEKMGLANIVIVPKLSVDAGTMKLRLMFPRLYINEPNCMQWLSAIRNYRKKWDEQKLKWSDEPVKDWTNHANDMSRYASLVEDQMTNDVSLIKNTKSGMSNPGSELKYFRR